MNILTSIDSLPGYYLHFPTWDNQQDLTWHEFESIEYTRDALDTSISLADFMSAIEKIKPFTW